MRSWLLMGALAGGCGSVANEKPIDAKPADSAAADMIADSAPTCVSSPAGLRARYRAENNANDHAGNFNGMVVGANFTYAAGKYGSAFQLDGVDDTVAINDGDQLWPAGSLSLEAWVKTTSPNTGNIIAKYACGSQCPNNMALAYFGLVMEAGGHPRFDFRPDSPTQDITSVVASTITINNGNWHHIVGVRDASALTASLYIDGALAASANPAAEQFGAMTNADNDVDVVAIGSSVISGQTSYNGFFAGAVDEVAIYHSALTAAQVQAIYSAPDGKCL